MRYRFVAVFDPGEDHGFTVTFPDLPGCITEGDTADEAILMAQEALSLHLRGLEDDGDPIPSSSSIESIIVPRGGFLRWVEGDTGNS